MDKITQIAVDGEAYAINDHRIEEVSDVIGSSPKKVVSQKGVTDAIDGLALKGSASGKVIRVDDVAPGAYPVKVMVTGVDDPSSVRVRVTGKNLLSYPYQNTTKTSNGITYTDNGDGSITAVGTATGSAYFILNNLKDYMANLAPGSGSTDALDNESVTNGIVTISKRVSFNANNGNISLNFYAGDTVNETFYPQVELGTVLTEYEPPKAAKVYIPGSDGTVDGVMSLFPVMTLVTDNTAAILDVECKRDPKVLERNISTLERNIETVKEEAGKSRTPQCEVIDNCQDVTKWTAALGEMTADTEDYIIGAQSIKFTNRIQLTTNPIPVKGKQFRIRFKVNEFGDGVSPLLMYIATDNLFTTYGFATLAAYGTNNKDVIRVGEWADMVVPLSAFGGIDMSTVTEINTIRLAFNNGTGSVNVQQIAVIDTPITKGIVSFTFDDGHYTNFTKAAPILAERGIPATAYIIPKYIGVSANNLTEEQVTGLKYTYGWDIECHMGTNLTTFTEDEVKTQCEEARTWIQEHGLGKGEHLAYPNGAFNETVEKIARRYFTTARTIDQTTLLGITSVHCTNPYRITARSSIGNSYGGFPVSNLKPLIDRVANAGGWLILVFHIIDDEIATSGEYCTTSALAEIADYVVASGVDIATVADVVNARK